MTVDVPAHFVPRLTKVCRVSALRRNTANSVLSPPYMTYVLSLGVVVVARAGNYSIERLKKERLETEVFCHPYLNGTIQLIRATKETRNDAN